MTDLLSCPVCGGTHYGSARCPSVLGVGHPATSASAPAGHGCSDCAIDQEVCPACYEAWWTKRHPNVVFRAPQIPSRAVILAVIQAWDASIGSFSDLTYEDMERRLSETLGTSPASPHHASDEVPGKPSNLLSGERD